MKESTQRNWSHHIEAAAVHRNGDITVTKGSRHAAIELAESKFSDLCEDGSCDKKCKNIPEEMMLEKDFTLKELSDLFPDSKQK